MWQYYFNHKINYKKRYFRLTVRAYLSKYIQIYNNIRSDTKGKLTSGAHVCGGAGLYRCNSTIMHTLVIVPAKLFSNRQKQYPHDAGHRSGPVTIWRGRRFDLQLDERFGGNSITTHMSYIGGMRHRSG